VRLEGGAHLVRRVRPLDAAVETFRVLAEDDHVDLGLLEAAVRDLTGG
jgi:hypothetical protein